MAQNKYLKQNGEIVYPYTMLNNILDYNISTKTMTVTFSGATGGSVDWNVIQIGNIVICQTAYVMSGNATITNGWGSIYISAQQSSPNFPITFDSQQIYSNISCYSADTADGQWMFRNSDATSSNPGNFRIARGQSMTLGHPKIGVFAMGKYSGTI